MIPTQVPTHTSTKTHTIDWPRQQMNTTQQNTRNLTRRFLLRYAAKQIIYDQLGHIKIGWVVHRAGLGCIIRFDCILSPVKETNLYENETIFYILKL